MARRIEIELTSARDDGTWTWRAAGAKQPRGVLDAKLLYDGAKTGDVVRADAEFEIDGITVINVLAPKAKRAEPERLELIAPANDEPGVRLVPAEGPRRPRRERDSDDRRGDERRGPRPPRDRDRGDRERPRTDRAPRGDRPPSERRERPPRAERPAPTPPPPKPKPKRLQPGRTHRDAVLADLASEQRPIAEQVLRGGIPAVRQAIEQENTKATAEGRPQVNAEAILAMAEELLPRVRSAEWLDRAEAAIAIVDEVSIRDLRSVVTAADTGVRDDAGRALATQLREGLERRLAAQRDEWVSEVAKSLDDGRVVRALRISGRPPEPGTRFPPELSERLGEAAAAAMSPEATPDRWAALLDAVASSPVRRSVKPLGLPAEPGDDLLAAAKKAAGRVPAVAALLGIEPPPAPPRAGDRPGRPPRPPRPEQAQRAAQPRGADGRPPPPPRPRTPPPPPAPSAPVVEVPPPPPQPETAPVVDVADAVEAAETAKPVDAKPVDLSADGHTETTQTETTEPEAPASVAETPQPDQPQAAGPETPPA